MNDEHIYEALADHLDRLPAGFPKTPTGVEMRILRRFFTPEEAALAPLLSLKPEAPSTIAARCGRDTEELAEKLEAMARKGLLFRVRRGDEARYMAAQFVIGIWEYHVNDLDLDLIRDANEYLPYFFNGSFPNIRTPQLRTIPISRSLSADQAILPYEEARRLIEEQERIVVAPCICRREHKMAGQGCDRPMESCLVFGMGAQYYEENGLGRPIGHEEALRILDEAERSGLVLQPSNAKHVVNICTCCGCCCQILKNLKRLPEPARHVASNYTAMVDPETCTACGICEKRCPMDAVRVGEGTAQVARERCIGCGVCVPTCSDGAIRLRSKPEAERVTPPGRPMEMLIRIARERQGREKAT